MNMGIITVGANLARSCRKGGRSMRTWIIGLVTLLFCLSTGLAVAEETTSDYDFGDMTSQTLTTNAWQALDVKDYDAVNAYVNKCIELYKGKALVMQASLTDFATKGTEFDYWALNDVSTCYFVKGMSLKEQGKLDEADDAFNMVMKDYSYGQCWDPKGWFWKPAEGARDQIKLIGLKRQGKDYDFGDYTSVTLTVKAWETLDKKDYEGTEIYTGKCIDLYQDEALKQQASLTGYLSKDKAFDVWALNDVGTCYFILGEALMGEGKYKEAKEAYKTVIDKLSYAQCWDPRGWFWKPAVGARGKINKLIAEHGV